MERDSASRRGRCEQRCFACDNSLGLTGTRLGLRDGLPTLPIVPQVSRDASEIREDGANRALERTKARLFFQARRIVESFIARRCCAAGRSLHGVHFGTALRPRGA
jgi:hypothetical protein